MLLDGNGSSQQLKIAWDHIGDTLAREGQWRQVRKPGSLTPAYIMTLHYSLKEICQHAMHAAVSIMLMTSYIGFPEECKADSHAAEDCAAPVGCQCCAGMRVLRESGEFSQPLPCSTGMRGLSGHGASFKCAAR